MANKTVNAESLEADQAAKQWKTVVLSHNYYNYKYNLSLLYRQEWGSYSHIEQE